MENKIIAIYTGILEGNAVDVRIQVEQALEAGVDPATILYQGMIAAMKEVGERFEQGDYFVPEMLIAARAMKEGLAILKPLLVKENFQSAGKVIIGTVKGDLHDIGKNLVGMMLEGAGYEVVDLGTDIAPDKFAAAAKESGAGIVALSALLTTTMVNMRTTIEALERAGLRKQVKVIVGGAPVTESFAQQIGADGYSSDASRAVALVHGLAAV